MDEIFGVPSRPADRKAADDDSGIATQSWLYAVGCDAFTPGIFTKRQVAAMKGMPLSHLERRAKHTHAGGNDICEKCGLDIRDDIHLRLNEYE